MRIVVEPQEGVEDQIHPSPFIDGMKEHGFSSQFFFNSWDELLNVGLMLFKLTLVRMMWWFPCRLIRRYFKAVSKKAPVYMVYEVLAGAPMILLPIGVMLGPKGGMGSINIQSKVNLAVFVSYSFFLFVAPFLIFYCEVELERRSQLQKERARRREAEKRKEEKRKEERMKAREEGKGGEKGEGGINVDKGRGETESENSVQPIEIELFPRQKEGKGVEEEKAELATTEKQLTR